MRTQDSPGRGRGGLPPPAHGLGHSLRPAPAGSPRVSSGAASTSSCKGNASGGCRALSSPPTGSPHLARPPPALQPKRALPRLQPLPHVLQPLPHVPQLLHGHRKLGAPRISRLEGDAGRQPMGTLGSFGGVTPRGAPGLGQPIHGAPLRQPMRCVYVIAARDGAGGAQRTARRGRRRWRWLGSG